MLSLLRQQAEQSLAFVSLVLIFLFFAFANSAFYSWSNITGILLSTAVTGMLAIGTTFVIITGGIDLSIGTATTLSAVVTARLLTELQLSVPAGILVGIDLRGPLYSEGAKG